MVESYTTAASRDDRPEGRVAMIVLDILERLAIAHAVPCSATARHTAVQAALSETVELDADHLPEVIGRAAERVGLRIMTVRRTVEEIAGASAVVLPVLVALRPTTSDGPWLMVEAARGGKFDVRVMGERTRSRRVTARQLLDEIGRFDERAVIPWLASERIEPLAEMTSRVIIETHRGHDEHGSRAHGSHGHGSHGHDGGGDGGHGGGHGGHHASVSPMQRMLGFLRPEKRDIGVVLIYAAFVGVLTLTVPISVSALVNTVAFGTLMQPLFALAVLVTVALAFSALLGSLRSYVAEMLARRMFVRVATDFAWRAPRLRADVIDHERPSELLHRFFDVITIQKGLTSLLLDGVAAALQIVVGLVLLGVYHPALLVFDLVLLAAILTMVVWYWRRAVRTSIEESITKYAFAAHLSELGNSATTFRSRSSAQFALDASDLMARQWIAARDAHFSVYFRQIIASHVVQVTFTVALLVLGGALVIGRELTLGQLVAAELVVTAVMSSLAKFEKHFANIYDVLAACDKIGHVVDAPLDATKGHALERSDAPAALALQSVSYTYAHSHAGAAFAPVTCTIAPGERVAIVGAPGAGKTTFCEIVAGLRAGAAGTISIDRQPYGEIQPHDLREVIAFCRGEELFSGTVLDNVRVGRQHVGVSEVRAALTTVGLYETVFRMPGGMLQPLGPDGRPLSSQQRLQLTLARCLASRPRLLVLDGCLDALSGEARAAVLDAVFDERRRFTVVFSTNQAELAARADRVIEIVGAGHDGSHAAHH